MPNVENVAELTDIIEDTATYRESTIELMQKLLNDYNLSHTRNVKGNGNAFYRAFMYAYMEKLIVHNSLGVLLSWYILTLSG